MSKNITKVKIWLREHKFVLNIGIIIILILICIPFIRLFINEQQIQNNDASQEKIVQLNNEQRELINNYNSETQNLITFMENSKWINEAGNHALAIEDDQFIERTNNKEEIQSFAICSYKKEEQLTGDFPIGMRAYNYNISIMLFDGKYKSLKLSKLINGVTENGEIAGASIESDQVFRNTNKYVRISNSNVFQISNWDANVNQFIDNKYDDMFKQLKEYCSKNYPHIKSLEWSGEVNVNYFNKSVGIPFYLDKKTSSSIVVNYKKDKKTFEVTKL